MNPSDFTPIEILPGGRRRRRTIIRFRYDLNNYSAPTSCQAFTGILASEFAIDTTEIPPQQLFSPDVVPGFSTSRIPTAENCQAAETAAQLRPRTIDTTEIPPIGN